MAEKAKRDSGIEEMLETNKVQKTFYSPNDLTLKSQGGLATRVWRSLRRRQMFLREQIGIENQIHDLHEVWMGDLSNKSVLDFGCYTGNVLSIPMAQKCRSYLGVDLSEKAIEVLNDKLVENKIDHAKAIAVDFLSPEFGEEKFDIIYADSVMHHFKYFDAFLAKLASHLNPGGLLITYDPMETSLLMWVARRLYRPFQSDSDWEWPFNKKSFEAIQNNFQILELQGLMGKAKWAVFLSMVNMGIAQKMGGKWHEWDLKHVNKINSDLWPCLQVSMCLGPKQDDKTSG